MQNTRAASLNAFYHCASVSAIYKIFLPLEMPKTLSGRHASEIVVCSEFVCVRGILSLLLKAHRAGSLGLISDGDAFKE